MTDDSNNRPKARRSFLKSFAVIPIATAGLTQLSGNAARAAQSTSPYTPTFFNQDEWRFINASCDRLIPHDEHGPGAVELGVPEFLDRHMQTPYANGDIWYTEGPYLDATPEFGYQGRLVLKDILRTGMKAVDKYTATTYQGKKFADLDTKTQDDILKGMESGKIHFDEIASKVFFNYYLGEVRNGYFSDPKYGGNKGMGSWKMIGYPGLRADYLDWVEVRDKAYPLPPVDLAGNRG